MTISDIIRRVYARIFVLFRKVKSGYYIKNVLECRRNRKLLAQARIVPRPSSGVSHPLISVRIPTYNRGKILVERTIPSVLRQTYQNFEIIVVGDHCADNTEEPIKSITDPRVNFVNLPERGIYPESPVDRWMVAGTTPGNKALDLCSGEWIAALDDDDEFSEDHLESLLNFARAGNYEMVYGKIAREVSPDQWVEVGSYPLKWGAICHLAVLYHSSLKFFKYDINSWKYGEPGDWNMWKRMKQAGVRIGFLDRVVGKHYLEMTRKGV